MARAGYLMAGVPNPFYTDPSLGKGVAAVVQAFTPDARDTLRGVQAQKTAYETREIRDRVAGREELGTTLAGFDPRDPASASTLQRVIIDAYRRGLKPQETAQFVMSLMSNGGADEAAVTRALVGAGHAPNVNQGVTYRDLQGRRSQIENEAARRTGITAGATIQAARIHNERPLSVPGAVYIPGKGFTENPYAPERFTSVAPDHSVFSQKDRSFVGTAPSKPGSNIKTLAPGMTLGRQEGDTFIPLYTAPDRTRAGAQPSLGFGADKQILSAIDEAFAVTRNPRERERLGLKPTDRLPLSPELEQRVKTRATQLYMDAASGTHRDGPGSVAAAIKEIVGGPDNLEPGGAAPDERSLIGRVFNSAPPPQYRVLKKDAKPGAASAMQKATERAPEAPAQPAAPSPGAAAPPAAPTGAEPLPFSPDGKVDGRRLMKGRVYDNGKGGRARWNGSGFELVR